jgi:TonB family protein
MFGFGLSVLLAGASCTQPETVPVVIKEPLPSLLLAALQAHGTANVVVTLPAEVGSPTKVELAASSGDPMVDAAALQAARRTVFSPETRDCEAVAGSYFYSVEV